MVTECYSKFYQSYSDFGRILLLTLVLSFLATTTLDAKGRNSNDAASTEEVTTPANDTIASSSVEKSSKWVNTRSSDPLGVMLNVWNEINLGLCLDDYRVLKVQIADSLETNKKPDETIRFYQPSLYTLTRMMDYRKFHPEGYSSRLTIYFYFAAALFLLMLIGWLVKSFIVSPFKK